jgi:hypothetical protein
LHGTASLSILVVAAHPGAGATCVSVALADALADFSDSSGRQVQLVDAAPSERSGMLGATDRDMATVHGLWRIGRRRAITVLRPIGVTSLADLPPLPRTEANVVLIDAGADVQTLVCGPHALWPPAAGAELVVVCRATVPGVRHAEGALLTLPGNPFVVGVGAKRWRNPVAAAFGPRLSTAQSQGRVGLIPADRHLELNGVETERFAKPVVVAAAHLIELIWPELTGPSAKPMKKGRGR